jgi:hypothetical protein
MIMVQSKSLELDFGICNGYTMNVDGYVSNDNNWLQENNEPQSLSLKDFWFPPIDHHQVEDPKLWNFTAMRSFPLHHECQHIDMNLESKPWCNKMSCNLLNVMAYNYGP